MRSINSCIVAVSDDPDRVAEVVLIRHDQRLKLKQEYYKFRHSTASMFTVVPFVLTLGLLDGIL